MTSSSSASSGHVAAENIDYNTILEKKEFDELNQKEQDGVWTAASQAVGLTKTELKILVEPRHRRFLGRLAGLKFDMDDWAPEDKAREARSAANQPFPEVNVSPKTCRPKRRRAQDATRLPDGRGWVDLKEIITDADKYLELKTLLENVRVDLKRAHLQCKTAREVHGKFGRKSRRPPNASKPCEILDRHCAAWARGLVFDCSNPRRCTLVNFEEVPRSKRNMKFVREMVGDSFKDKELLHALEFGCTLKSKFPMAVAVAPPHVSAREWLSQLEEGIDKEIENEWLQVSASLPYFPYMACAYGAVLKKNRFPPVPRRTTDMSYDPNGKGVSVNGNINMEEDFPELSYVKIRDFMKAGATIRSMWQEVTADMSDQDKKFLEPIAVCEDLKSFFNMLHVAKHDVHLQGMYWVDSQGTGKFLTSDVLQFGSSVGPQWGQRVGNMFDGVTRRQMAEWEDFIRHLADGSDPNDAKFEFESDGVTREEARQFANRISPKPLRDLIARRRALMGEDQAKCSFLAQYIDDFTCKRYRGIEKSMK